jgi:large subunit ribosomal protein L2
MAAVSGLKIGKILISSKHVKLKKGNSTFIKFIPRNIKISCIESSIASSYNVSRSPGSFSIVTKKSKFFSILKITSKLNKKFTNFSYCTIGRICYIRYKLVIRRLAGISRLKGFRPNVRGVAMNPIDHPHGGGVGKKSKKAFKMSP